MSNNINKSMKNGVGFFGFFKDIFSSEEPKTQVVSTSNFNPSDFWDNIKVNSEMTVDEILQRLLSLRTSKDRIRFVLYLFDGEDKVSCSLNSKQIFNIRSAISQIRLIDNEMESVADYLDQNDEILKNLPPNN